MLLFTINIKHTTKITESDAHMYEELVYSTLISMIGENAQYNFDESFKLFGQINSSTFRSLTVEIWNDNYFWMNYLTFDICVCVVYYNA